MLIGSPDTTRRSTSPSTWGASSIVIRAPYEGPIRAEASTDSRDSDQSALAVDEMPDDETIWRCSWTHHTSASQALRPLKRGFDIRNANVEHSVAVVALASSDAAADTSRRPTSRAR
jgi:hypothetical protein